MPSNFAPTFRITYIRWFRLQTAFHDSLIKDNTMTNTQLAKKALDKVQDCYFDLVASASTGSRCGDSYDVALDLELSREQLLYLIRMQSGHKEVFEGLKLEKIDLDAVAYDMGMEAMWPDGGPCATVNDVIPKELCELSEQLECLDITDTESVKAIREKLLQVSDGEYTFCFTVEASDYLFAEDAEESIELSAKEALGLLYGEHNIKEVFRGICRKSYGEDLINSKAEKKGFADDYDTFCYNWSYEELEAYLDAWNYILNAIMSDEITEENMTSWLEYFDDAENYEYRIAEWYEEIRDC